MLDFISSYGLFFAKIVTIVLAIIVIFLVIAASAAKSKATKLKLKKINEQYDEYKKTLNHEILSKPERKQLAKAEKEKQKANKQQAQTRKRVFVLDFNGDLRAQATSSLREEITAILTVAKPEDEVVVKLESPGGVVPCYGLAASQLKRLRDRNIPLTIVVDKIAASGGYMMACVGSKILAAPYSVIGSIGVIAQLPNFHRLLKKNDIDFEQITAGQYKRTLSLFGEITESGREKVQEDVNSIHDIFKAFVSANRPEVDIEKVATGEHWHGVQALELKLVDELYTSDDYLLKLSEDRDIYELHYEKKKTLADKLSLSLKQAYHAFFKKQTNYDVFY